MRRSTLLTAITAAAPPADPEHIGARFVGGAFGATSVSVDVPNDGGSANGDTVFFVALSYSASVWANDTGDLTKHGSDDNGCVVFSRVIDGTEDSSYTFTRSGTTTSHAAVLAIRRSNHGAVTATAVSTAAGTASLNVAGVTTSAAGSTYLQIAAKLAPAGGTWSTTAGATERYEGTSSGYDAAYGEEIIPGASTATGTRLWTVSNSTGNSRGVGIAINPL